MKLFKSGFLGILILLIGVVVGVLLVAQTTSFKNKAKEKAGKTYTVCHKTGNPASPWKEISVDGEELPSYLNSGDIFGECPEE